MRARFETGKRHLAIAHRQRDETAGGCRAESGEEAYASFSEVRPVAWLSAAINGRIGTRQDGDLQTSRRCSKDGVEDGHTGASPLTRPRPEGEPSCNALEIAPSPPPSLSFGPPRPLEGRREGVRTRDPFLWDRADGYPVWRPPRLACGGREAQVPAGIRPAGDPETARGRDRQGRERRFKACRS